MPALTFVTAGQANALQVAHFGRIDRRKLLWIDAKGTEQLWEFVGGALSLGSIE
jgi:hypothetical protein